MSASPANPRALVLDIEGTTTPISFVHERLFPYASAHLSAYVSAHWNEDQMLEVRERLAAEHAADGRGDLGGLPSTAPGPGKAADVGSYISYAQELIAADRKSPGLKLLQGLIWKDGYEAGELRGQVWDDVPAAMRRWKDAGKTIAIYSSGSALAQRLLFESTEHGDLTPLISVFFDTSVGAKTQDESYRKIAAALNVPPEATLFVSDVTAELRAAQTAGMQVLLSVRPGNPPQADALSFPQITTLDDL